MKTTVLICLVVTTVVMAFPTDKDTNFDSGIQDIIKSISNIQGKVKEMRGITLGNYSDNAIETEFKNGFNSLTKNVTYENLIERVQLASKKIKELQSTLSRTTELLNKNYPRPDNKEPV